MPKETRKFDLEDRLIEFGVRIIRLAQALRKRELETTLPAKSFAAARPRPPIMAKHRAANPALTLFTKCKYASRNYVKPGYGCL
jgi:hypothetical protein